MKKLSLKSILGILGPAMLVVGVAIDSGSFDFANLALRLSRATGTSVVLNNSNAPTLVGGNDDRIDDKSITWEYRNCTSYASGHVKINSGGYFGISSTSIYGYTGINDLSVNFTKGGNGELWLLTSYNGTDWNEMKEFKDEDNGVATTLADNWRYIRFYNYAPDNSQISITSVSFDYTCEGVSAIEDNDGALPGNVLYVTDNLTYSLETQDLSPRCTGTKAVRFTKSGNASSEIIISFGRTYVAGDVATKKIEFDMKTSNIVYGKTLQLMNGTADTDKVGTVVKSNDHSSYKCTNIEDDWYHIEVPISCLYSLISGYYNVNTQKRVDMPGNIATKEFCAIKINAGACVIDNLRITSSDLELGIYNNYSTGSVGAAYNWLKVSYVGKLRSCTMTFDDPTIAEQIPVDDPNIKNGSPFYIRGLSAGTVTITVTVVSGYCGQFTHSINRTMTLS